MSDNTESYITYGELLVDLSMSKSPLVRTSQILLANKQVDGAGDLYDYAVTGSDPTPTVGDVVTQAGFADVIKEILTAPNRLRVYRTGPLNQIQNGPTSLLHSDDIPKARGEALIKMAMAKIDQDTGQFFNKRSGTFSIEGNNSPVLFFNVPIITIRKLKINSTEQELIEGMQNDFLAFKGRSEPQDDRRNPRIKLNTRTDNIFSGVFTNRVFLKDTYTEIDGDFGFLEPDGSTPLLIKKATGFLVIQEVENPVLTSTPTTGSLKRIKVDLHEQEFFEPKSQGQAFGASANEDYNRIVASYRRPLLIGGSFKEVRERL